MSAKRSFVVVDDYGMGGIWMLIDAESRSDIEDRWPELTVMVPGEREWFTEEKHTEFKQKIREDMHFDIDDPPTGYLADFAR